MIEKIVGDKQYVIPPRPAMLLNISRLLMEDEPNVERIVEALKQDPSLYAAVLTSANFFAGKQKVTSIDQAVMRIGLKKLHMIIRIAALKNALSKAGKLERFWDTGSEVASVCTNLARHFGSRRTDDAYTLGILHDCGVPLMMESFKVYREFVRRLPEDNLAQLHLLEKQRFGFDHFQIGGEICQRWQMPEQVSQTIALQPYFAEAMKSDQYSDAVKELLSFLILAKNISGAYRRYWRIERPESSMQPLAPVFEFLGISDIDYQDIFDDQLAILEAAS